MKELWRTLSSFMGQKTAKAEDNSHTANDFAIFFADMVEAVRMSISTVPLQDIPYTATHIFILLHYYKTRVFSIPTINTIRLCVVVSEWSKAQDIEVRATQVRSPYQDFF